MANIQFTTRKQGEMIERNNCPDIVAFDVSSYAKKPFKQLSPFTYSEKFKIPVPGMKNTYSDSVEGIWQGLKIIDGSTDTLLFKGRPRKRKGNVAGHQYGDRVVGVQAAREDIYIPSYFFFLENCAPKEALSAILDEQRHYKRVYLYDVESNGNLSKPEPFAHASALAAYLNMTIMHQKYSPINAAEKKLFSVLDKDITLEDKVRLIEPILCFPEVKNAFQYRCVEHPPNDDDFHIAEYFGRGSKK